jgi:hypothetical protein
LTEGRRGATVHALGLRVVVAALLASVMGAVVAAPGAVATDTVNLAIVNDSQEPIQVDSQQEITTGGFGTASSDCYNRLPITVAPGDTEQPCSLMIDTRLFSDGNDAWWAFNGTYTGSTFSFGMYVDDPNIGKLEPCWIVDGRVQSSCTGDPPPGAQAGLCTPVADCPFELSETQPFLASTGGKEYGLTWLAPGVGKSLAVAPRATLSGRSAKLRTKCNRDVGCRGKLQLAADLGGASRPSTIGTRGYRIKPGRRIVHVPLGRAARRHLRRHGRLTARATVRPRGANGFPRPIRSRVLLALR